MRGRPQICHYDVRATQAFAKQQHQMIDLSSRTLIRVTGEDATAFLQGQLTQDIDSLAPSRVLWAAHCSPKGRMLASFLIWHSDNAYWLDAPEDMAEPALRRLRMYVLRSRVVLEDARANNARIGLCGTEIAVVLKAARLAPPPAVGTHDTEDGITRIALSSNRLMLLAAPQVLHPLQALLAQHSAPHKAKDWTDAAVSEGIAEINVATQDEWIPQMLNWDLVGGVSFRKGCYTGQEIVARTHYLGKVKRRLLRFRVMGSPLTGQELFHEAGTPAGKIAMVGKSTAEGTELLAVVQLEALSASALHLGSTTGPVLQLLTLPYPVALE